MLDLPSVPLVRSSDVRRTGDSERQLVRAAKSGDMSRVRPGAYTRSELWQSLTDELRHGVAVIAANDAAIGRPVFSHESAAVIWRFPIVGGLPHRPQITVSPGSGLRSNGSVVRHEAPLAASEVTDASVVRLTSLERTLVDFAATRAFLSGACAMEYLLHAGLTDPDLIRAAIEARRPFRGSRKVEAVAQFAHEFSASPNETLCRVRFEELGFRQPEQQKEYRGIKGQQYFVDFYWPEFDVICETDGRVKYENPEFLAGRTPQQALWDEKRREDELRAQCRALVRLTWDDAWNRTGLVAKLTRAGIPRAR